MELDEVDPVDPEALEGPLQARPGTGLVALTGLRGEEEVLAASRQPGGQAELGIPIGGGDVEVVDAVRVEDGQEAIGLLLGRPAQGGRTEDHNAALVPRPAEPASLDHRRTP